MSGTSLDGLDIAYCHLWQTDKGIWDFKILEAETVSYSSDWKSKLKNAIYLSDEEHKSLDNAYGCLLYTSPSPRDS